MVKDNKTIKSKKNTVNLNQKTRVEKNKDVIKKNDYIEEEGTFDKKILIGSLVLAVLLGGLVYFLLTKDAKDEKPKDKKPAVEEKKEEEEEELSIVEDETPVVYVNNKTEEKKEVKEKEVYYTIKYFNIGDNLIDDSIVESKEKTVDPKVPQREGWDFDGWYTDETFTEGFTFGGFISKDTNLYAKWVKNICYIADETTESCIKETKVAENEIIPLINEEGLNEIDPSILERIGYGDTMTFGWFLVNEELETEILEGTKLTEDYSNKNTISLLIKGLEKFKVNFYAIEKNDNNTEEEILLTDYDAVEGRTIDFTGADEKAEERLNCGEECEYAWYYMVGEIKSDFQRDKKADSNIKKLYLSDEVYSIRYMEEIVTEEEKETILEEEKIIVSDTEYKEIDTIDYAIDSNIEVLDPKEKEGYTFDGWHVYDETNKVITEDTIKDGDKITEDITVVEKWIKNPDEEVIDANLQDDPEQQEPEGDNNNSDVDA